MTEEKLKCSRGSVLGIACEKDAKKYKENIR